LLDLPAAILLVFDSVALRIDLSAKMPYQHSENKGRDKQEPNDECDRSLPDYLSLIVEVFANKDFPNGIYSNPQDLDDLEI
jgi:hypothetical protein